MVYCIFAISYFETERFDEALKASEKMQDIDPQHSQAWYYPGFVHKELAKKSHDPHEKKQHLESALKFFNQSQVCYPEDDGNDIRYCQRELAKLN